MATQIQEMQENVTPAQGTTEVEQDAALAKSMERTTTMGRPNWFLIAAVAAVILGLGTGYVAAAVTKAPTPLPLETATGQSGQTAAAATIKVGQVFGSQDARAFKDSAEGIILPGGIGNEGSHHLVRAGGASQNVYLTSSVVDLKMFENAKVKVFGETFQGKKAGWLMDVGRVEVEELNAPLPDWVVKQQATQAPAASD